MAKWTKRGEGVSVLTTCASTQNREAAALALFPIVGVSCMDAPDSALCTTSAGDSWETPEKQRPGSCKTLAWLSAYGPRWTNMGLTVAGFGLRVDLREGMDYLASMVKIVERTEWPTNWSKAPSPMVMKSIISAETGHALIRRTWRRSLLRKTKLEARGFVRRCLARLIANEGTYLRATT